ncbi:hypothetical protein O181_007019 [Austropuccinia psidii MF-1]|uniref:Uncharacterized protein n=1 Tax=Austropuccinia psidii MF-1 TaxID=1389203 RepID=A0A9Q3GHG4_9BASI|nr:hypothetical protein [Austropuccinia psidii MF-1]
MKLLSSTDYSNHSIFSYFLLSAHPTETNILSIQIPFQYQFQLIWETSRLRKENSIQILSAVTDFSKFG